jgi:hypothetical protein
MERPRLHRNDAWSSVGPPSVDQVEGKSLEGQEGGKATDRRPVPSQDDRREEGHAQADPYQALERLRKARGRLRAAREETGSEESGAVISADKHPA